MPLKAPQGAIEFSHVSFGYDKTRKILDDIDFSVEPGETIGIVGETGAGKSTLVNLLIRLYDVGEGKISIDGIDVKDLSFEDLHKAVAIVSQETYLFEGTIMENIRYAKPDATDEEVFMAAKIADAGVSGFSTVNIIIGSSFGLSDRVKQKAHFKLSISKMTLPHQLARVVCLEQTYRAFAINNGSKYHK